METLVFILHNLPAIGERTLEHVSIVSVAVGFAILTGVPLGIAITHSQRAADTVLYLRLDRDDDPVDCALRRADPAAVEDRPGHRLPARRDRGDALRATADRAQHVHGDPQPRPCAAFGRGRDGHVAFAAAHPRRDPIALPVIIAGVRIAVVINIGVTAIAAYIGAGGLGTFISRGISQTDIRQLITGALALALLAIAADYALLWLSRWLAPKGMGRAPLTDWHDPPRSAHQGFPSSHAGAASVDRVSFEVGGGRDVRAAGPVGVRQDHDAAHDRPAGHAHVGQGVHRRTRHRCDRPGARCAARSAT